MSTLLLWFCFHRNRQVKDHVLDEGFWKHVKFMVDMLQPTCDLIKAIQTDHANLAGTLAVCMCKKYFFVCDSRMCACLLPPTLCRICLSTLILMHIFFEN